TIYSLSLHDALPIYSGLTTYNRLKNLNIFDNQIDDLKYRNDFEKIIEWSTIFEDKSIYKEKLRSIDWLNEKQINALSNIRLQGRSEEHTSELQSRFD